jgi:Copper type II ascorbate-dependent monooxygenase, C-terminal domain
VQSADSWLDWRSGWARAGTRRKSDMKFSNCGGRLLSAAVVSVSVLIVNGCPSGGSSGDRDNGTAGLLAGTAGVSGGFAGTDMNIGTAGVTGGTAGTGNTGVAGRPTLGSTALPCDLRDIFKLQCQSCHGNTPLAGVPMALMSWEDLEAPAISDPSKKVRDLVATRVHDTSKPMPPPPSQPLAAENMAIVDAWIAGGGLAGTDPSCAPVDMKAPEYYGGVMPPDVEDCWEIRAHANSTPGDTTPLTVSGENYSSFYFDAPWPAGSQAVYFETLPGDHPEILHHWLIYAEENANEPDGKVVYPALGTHPSAPTLVAGWAPGANNNDFPSNVGVQLDGPNRKMSMEIHFFGQAGVPTPTDAGVKICTVTKNLRPNTATISWLGTELGINLPPRAKSTATGTCTPQYDGEIHILRSWPHMHLMGRKMESVIVRKDGKEEPMNPPGGWDFDFNNEVSHKSEFVLQPGDTVRTTCHYDNTSDAFIQVGFENRYEMCFNFVMAYPAKALVNKGVGGSTSLTNSATACLY